MAFPSVVIVVLGILLLWWAMNKLDLLPSEGTNSSDG